MPRFAAIDLGSNALRLRIVEAHRAMRSPSIQPVPRYVVHGSGFTEVKSLRVPVRLGAEVYVTGRLSTIALEQACAALRLFSKEMIAADVDAYRAVTTSAVREAQNGDVLVKCARHQGIDLQVVDGTEEARLIRLAVLAELPLKGQRAIVVDVGGGSTEVSILEEGEDLFSMSLPLGTVRLLETQLRVDGIRTDRGESPTRVHLVEQTVSRAFDEVWEVLKGTVNLVVATGGNSETLADLCPANVPAYPRTIHTGVLRAFAERLVLMPISERRTELGLGADRADTILPAALIYRCAADLIAAKFIVVPGVGLKEGILEDLIGRYFERWKPTSPSGSSAADP